MLSTTISQEVVKGRVVVAAPQNMAHGGIKIDAEGVTNFLFSSKPVSASILFAPAICALQRNLAMPVCLTHVFLCVFSIAAYFIPPLLCMEHSILNSSSRSVSILSHTLYLHDVFILQGILEGLYPTLQPILMFKHVADISGPANIYPSIEV